MPVCSKVMRGTVTEWEEEVQGAGVLRAGHVVCRGCVVLGMPERRERAGERWRVPGATMRHAVLCAPNAVRFAGRGLTLVSAGQRPFANVARKTV